MDGDFAARVGMIVAVRVIMIMRMIVVVMVTVVVIVPVMLVCRAVVMVIIHERRCHLIGGFAVDLRGSWLTASAFDAHRYCTSVAVTTAAPPGYSTSSVTTSSSRPRRGSKLDSRQVGHVPIRSSVSNSTPHVWHQNAPGT